MHKIRKSVLFLAHNSETFYGTALYQCQLNQHLSNFSNNNNNIVIIFVVNIFYIIHALFIASIIRRLYIILESFKKN